MPAEHQRRDTSDRESRPCAPTAPPGLKCWTPLEPVAERPRSTLRSPQQRPRDQPPSKTTQSERTVVPIGSGERQSSQILPRQHENVKRRIDIDEVAEYKAFNAALKAKEEEAIALFPSFVSVYEQEKKNKLVKELKESDVIIISAPIYNYGPPATLKAWSDLAARIGETFKFKPNGRREGLLKNKKAYLVITSGGTKLNSNEDFLTPWLKFILNFFGIEKVETISADQMALDYEKSIKEAHAQIDKIKL